VKKKLLRNSNPPTRGLPRPLEQFALSPPMRRVSDAGRSWPVPRTPAAGVRKPSGRKPPFEKRVAARAMGFEERGSDAGGQPGRRRIASDCSSQNGSRGADQGCANGAFPSSLRTIRSHSLGSKGFLRPISCEPYFWKGPVCQVTDTSKAIVSPLFRPGALADPAARKVIEARMRRNQVKLTY
jgi:hypothetical protein